MAIEESISGEALQQDIRTAATKSLNELHRLSKQSISEGTAPGAERHYIVQRAIAVMNELLEAAGIEITVDETPSAANVIAGRNLV